MTIIFLCIVAILFYTFDSCFLSIIEQNYCNDDFVIIDPILEYYDLEINNKNRYFISNMIGIPYILIVFIIYYFRFFI